MSSSKFVTFLVIFSMAAFAYLAIQWTNSELTSIRAGAVSSSSLETENGVPSNVLLQSDTLASSGNYIEFEPTPLRTLYVSPTGSDVNPGTKSQPFKSFYKAAQVAQAGDLVLFMDGMYTESVTTDVMNSGTAAHPIIFRSQNFQKAVIYYQNMYSKWRVNITGHPYIHIENFEITGDDNFGAPDGSDKFLNFFDGSDYAVVRGNKIHHIYEDLVKFHNSKYGLIENNTLFDCIHEGIDVVDNANMTIRNNMISDVARQAMMIKGGSRNIRIFDNTITQDTGTEYVAIGMGGSTDSIFAYNPSGYEGYNQIAYNNVVVVKNGAHIEEALKLQGCTNCAYVNNVVVNAERAMVTDYGGGTAKGWSWSVNTNNPTFENNIILNCSKSALTNWDLVQGVMTVDYNLIYNCPNTPNQGHGIVSDPLFMDPLSDWHLQSTSPARGKGISLSPFPTFTDTNNPPTPPIDVSINRDQTQRGTPWSIGAY